MTGNENQQGSGSRGPGLRTGKWGKIQKAGVDWPEKYLVHSARLCFHVYMTAWNLTEIKWEVCLFIIGLLMCTGSTVEREVIWTQLCDWVQAVSNLYTVPIAGVGNKSKRASYILKVTIQNKSTSSLQRHSCKTYENRLTTVTLPVALTGQSHKNMNKQQCKQCQCEHICMLILSMYLMEPCLNNICRISNVLIRSAWRWGGKTTGVTDPQVDLGVMAWAFSIGEAEGLQQTRLLTVQEQSPPDGLPLVLLHTV